MNVRAIAQSVFSLFTDTNCSLPWEFESSENVMWVDEKSVGPCESLTVEKPENVKVTNLIMQLAHLYAVTL